MLRALRRRGTASPEVDVERLNRAPDDESFVTGNGFAARCGTVLNYGPVRRNDGGRRDWCFCKTDFLDEFFERHAPPHEFVLVSHNSDYPVDATRARHVCDPRLRMWFAANLVTAGPKLRPVPLGIANPSWPHGDGATLHRLQEEPPPKTRLFDVSFSLDTNPAERGLCVEHTGLTPEPPRPFPAYAAALASSLFCISPRGYGVDTHRTWEALYLRTVPVVTRSILTDHHGDLPLVVLEDWSEFGAISFSRELYDRTMGDWDPAALRLDRYLERLDRIAEGAVGGPR
jgi:hypothetical protein